MGDPGRQRKKFTTPFRPYDKLRIEAEENLLKEFELRRKKELWRMEGIIRNFRRRARNLLAEGNEMKERELIEHLQKLGILDKGAKLEDVLSLETKDLLGRRLQTLVVEKEIANSLKQARQMIVHGHVRVDGRVVKWPSYLVTIDEENKITADLKIEPPKGKKVKETKEVKHAGKKGKGDEGKAKGQAGEGGKEKTDEAKGKAKRNEERSKAQV